VNEKSQVQALKRTQPMLPMGSGYLEGLTYDYYRHGTTTLFAALNGLAVSIIAQCRPRRHQEFLSFLNHLGRNVSGGLEIHLIADNYATHKHSRSRRGWHATRATTFITRRPMPAGQSRLSATSRSSPRTRSAAASFAAYAN
jgi:putative transposase